MHQIQKTIQVKCLEFLVKISLINVYLLYNNFDRSSADYILTAYKLTRLCTYKVLMRIYGHENKRNLIHTILSIQGII